jgi:hypothetical protein
VVGPVGLEPTTYGLKEDSGALVNVPGHSVPLPFTCILAEGRPGAWSLCSRQPSPQSVGHIPHRTPDVKSAPVSLGNCYEVTVQAVVELVLADHTPNRTQRLAPSPPRSAPLLRARSGHEIDAELQQLTCLGISARRFHGEEGARAGAKREDRRAFVVANDGVQEIELTDVFTRRG